ncbi:LamG-like jellyroll fold domain-containing protein [Halalkalibacterium halodurans]|uniref:LamG-like jellyroll fold domain-containing protein n=1 Tax=Halalkalibacterium halodurans TaxID=86665 RepID=UPI002AA96662|nr:LamG-like jellyroll fold domain-containing protein [Halalkalibacterium halodurans]MDY7223284.1 LamG-like jellyroll fold domain-containing protein [Halalkalibacterium halodurans]MDY7242505.1 LamG-like jellyroll fold domain-containing protein [Halalkalibacterium halodurans]
MQSAGDSIHKKQNNLNKKILILCLVILLSLQGVIPMSTSVTYAEDNGEQRNGYLDKIDFGDTKSENAHNFRGDFTSVITGFMGEKARVSNFRADDGDGGELTFTMKVDPYLRNYFTVKFSGEESSPSSMVHINGEQIGYITYGDYEAINKGWMLPNRFFYNTIMLPLESTVGKETVEITINSDPWGDMTSDSRGYYSAYTHTQAYMDVDGEEQGYKFKPDQNPENMVEPDLTDEEKQALIDNYMQDQINQFNNLSAKVDESDDGKLAIHKYVEELKFYANVLKYDLSPAETPEEKRAALERIFKTIDNHVKDYYGNTRLVLRGGHQGDWGGYYMALGEALYMVENLIKDDEIYGEEEWDAFLDEPFETGTEEGEFSLPSKDWDGGELTRRAAWERVMKANFDFARARLSYIYNQVVYTYEGAWKSHEGLRIIGSPFFEGKERSHRILLETLGIKPFLGEEVLVGPDGEELDLYHSLFAHDQAAVFTDDFVHIVGKGLAKSKLDEEGNVVRRLPYGKHYTGLTEAGLTRENGYVANYGEAANYLLIYFYKTLNKAGDEEMNDEILKAALRSIHARGFVRYHTLDEDGKRIMQAEHVTDERNQGLSGLMMYGARTGTGMSLQFASLEMMMAENEQRYSGPEWDEYWQYARDAVGFVQQQQADRQLMHTRDFGNRGSMRGVNFLLPESYHYITEGRADYDRFDGNVMAGVVLPHTDFDVYKPEEIADLEVNPDDYEQFAWADIDNMYVSVKDGDFRMFGALNYRNRGMASNGRLHVIKDNYEHIVQIATNNRFQYEDYYLRAPQIDWDFHSGSPRNLDWDGAPQVLAGEPAPASYQPGVGTVNRDNFEVDNPYNNYPELSTSRYGKYFIIFNTTRDVYGNERTFDVELPADFSGSEVLDLVSGENIPVKNGKVTIQPKTTMVLKLTSDIELNPKPFHVDFVNALAGNGYVGISWKTTSGGQSYTIKRSEAEDGSYEIIAEGVTGNYYKDTTVQNGNVYYYKVAAVNENGAGWDSWRAKVDLSKPVSGDSDKVWRDDRIGTTEGNAAIDDSSISIDAVDGAGFGEGDDSNIYKRDIFDSLHFVSQVAEGNSSISAKIDSASGEASGIMMRDRLTEDKARYIYFGANENGDLVLQNRTRVSIAQFWIPVASPLNANIEGYTAKEYPYVKLMRDHDSQTVYAYVSRDGENWTYVTEMSTLLPYAYYTGVTSSDQAQFSEVTVKETPQGIVTPFTSRVQDQVTLHWNKPKQASSFNVYRTYDEEASLTDPVFKEGTTELEDGSPWEEVLTGTRATSFEDVLRFGSVHYKVMAVHNDGSPQPLSITASAYADSIEVVLENAESLPAEDYTKASFYLFHKELDRIKAELAKPEFDEEQLIEEIYDATNLLVSVRTLLTKIEMDPSMVRASEKFWRNDDISEEENGWFLFDEDPDTITHTRSEVSWVDVDFGAGNEKVIDTFRYLPRRTHVNRVNGTVFKGSNDGENWIDLYKIQNASEYKWYSALNSDPTPYRFIRIYDDHNGFVNFEEIEFLEIPVDKTLLTLLLEEAEAANDAGIYTAESLQALALEVDDAEAVLDNVDATQEEVDEVDNRLLAALEALIYIEGMPVLESLRNKTVIAENTLTFRVEAMNAADDVVYGVKDLPEGASFDKGTQVFEWTPSKEQGGVHDVTFTVAAGKLESSRTIKITVKGQPVFESVKTVELTAEEPFTYQVPVSDLTGEALVYSVDELPKGASFNTSTGQLKWTPAKADYGSHPITFTASNKWFEVSQTIDFKVNLKLLSPEDYTKGSYYLYLQEVERIQEELVKPDADIEQLLAELEQAEEQLDQVPLSLYSFEDNLENAFGIHEGTAHGNVGYTDGKIGQAVNLNGVDSYLTLPAKHPFTGYDEITVATWVNWRGGGNWQRIFDFGNNREQYLFLTPSSGNNTLRFAIRNGGSEQIVQTSRLASNQWVHVAVTLGERTARLYVNGELMATNNNVTIKPSDFEPSNNYIGNSQWPDPLFNGMIDEFYIYNYALSEEEIQAVYNNTAKWIDNTLIPVLLDEAAAIDTEAYTEESVEALQAAVKEAQSVYNNADATQEEIDAASATLLAALEGLQLEEDVTVTIEPDEPNGKNGWYTSPVTMTLSPAATAEYSLDGGSSWTAYKEPVILNEEGTHKVMYRSKTAPDNEKSLEVKIDLTPPEVEIIGETSYTVDSEISISCVATDAVSGVDGTPCDKPLLQVVAYELEPGEHTVRVEVEDMAGNKQKAAWTFVVEATYDSLAVLSERFVTETGSKGTNGISNALKKKLANAKRAYERENYEEAQDLLQSYIEQVQDLAGNKLPEEEASILIRWAEQLLDTLS